MKIATWNLNNRVGRVRFRLEAARAAAALDADILVLTEFFPGKQETEFRTVLGDGGWANQQISPDSGVIANRILIASRLPLQPSDVPLPEFDRQFPSNVAAVHVPSLELTIVGVRVPWYVGKDRPFTAMAWDWLEATAVANRSAPSLILGDLNVAADSPPSRGIAHLRRILDAGWKRAQPSGSSYFGQSGFRSEIDYILGTEAVDLVDPHFVTEKNGFTYAGGDDALSDHAPLISDVLIR
jgi:hypothetical protein